MFNVMYVRGVCRCVRTYLYVYTRLVCTSMFSPIEIFSSTGISVFNAVCGAKLLLRMKRMKMQTTSLEKFYKKVCVRVSEYVSVSECAELLRVCVSF